METGLEWPTCNPDLVLQVLRSLKPEMCANNKAFFKTYMKWSQLDATQRNRSKSFWSAQSDPVKRGVITEVNSLELVVMEDESVRSSQTNRHDRCRLMHLMVDAEMQATWTKALSPLEREELDVPELRKSSYEDLAEAFNDRAERTYQNVCIVHEDGRPLNPYQSLPNLDAISQTCYDLDPNDSTRPSRDATWLEKQSKEIRGVMSKCYQNFRKSGNQDAENVYSEWCKFVSTVSDVYKYCFVLMPGGLLDQLGRALPDDMQRDTGGRPPRDYSHTPSAVNRRRQRERRRAEQGAEEQSTASSPDLASVLKSAVKKQQKQQALFHFAAHGDAEEQTKAKARLASLAFSDDDEY